MISRSMKSCVGMFMKMDLVRVAVGVDLMVREVGDKIQLSRIAVLLEHQVSKLAFELSRVYLGPSF